MLRRLSLSSRNFVPAASAASAAAGVGTRMAAQDGGSAKKNSKGDLVDVLLQQPNARSPVPLIDIGINLVDSSFDVVRCCLRACYA